MKKKYIEQKKKYTTNTYMREAIDYEIIIVREDNYYVTIKKYLDITEPFILNKKIYIDKNYYLVEITPLEENYNIRFYYDDKKELIDYYIDITYKNGVEYKIPYYVDLYLDIIHYPKSNTIAFCDEDELKEALDKKIISKKDYQMAYKIGNKLLNEIKENKNLYLNINTKKYIDKYYN